MEKLQALETTFNLFAYMVLFGFAGMIVGHLVPNKNRSLTIATYAFLGACGYTVFLAVVTVLVKFFVGEPSHFIPVWLAGSAVCLYTFTAGITRGIDIRACGYWRWFPRTPVLRN